MKILVTGATGYVGGRLVPLLLDRGHEVRTTTSDPSKEGPWWSDRVETVEMNILDADQVTAACEGVDAVYYLIHGMKGEDFVETDRQGATNMANAVRAQGVGRVVYLSGLVPPVDHDELSRHIASRLEVEEILSSTPAVTITLRAAVLMGSGSTSFEVIRQVSERLPLQTVPDWMQSQVQPIAIVDVLECLYGALSVPGPSRSYDVGGPDRMPYPELLETYADLADLTRPQVTIPLLPTQLVGTLVGQLTDVPAQTVESLIESLHHDMVCGEDDFLTDLLPEEYDLMGVEESIRRSLAPRTAEPAEADPMGPLPHDPAWTDGGDVRPVVAKAVDAVKSVVPGQD